MDKLALDLLAESRLNPRKEFAPEALAELAASVKEHGVLQPILVRPHPGGNGATHEIVAGHRRFRAAKSAGLAEIPVVVREIADDVALELMLTENLRRADLHPMEEAQGYEVLHGKHGRSVEDIAARVGKSASYVYDRMKLCELVPEVRKDFLADRFSAGHAVLLARLGAKDQERALRSAVYEQESPLFAGEGESRRDMTKPRSVRELKAWIDGHVRFTFEEVDQMVFPETAAAVETAVAEEAKVLAITHEHQVRPDARGGKTLSCRSWKRADGEGGSKRCEHAELGVVVAGPGRGEAFEVCAAKKKCKTHWGAEMRAKARRAKDGVGGGGGVKTMRDRYAAQEAKHKAAMEREEAERARYTKALPAIREAFVARLKEMKVSAGGPLAQILLRRAYGYGANPKKLQQEVPPGPELADLVRHLAYLKISGGALNEYHASRIAPAMAKALAIDLKAILDEHAPVERKQKKTKKKAGGRKARK